MTEARPPRCPGTAGSRAACQGADDGRDGAGSPDRRGGPAAEAVLRSRVAAEGDGYQAPGPRGLARNGHGTVGGWRVPSEPFTTAGHGIIGMRERAHLCGGKFSARPLAEGGFQVTASLPLPAMPCAEATAWSIPAQPLTGAPRLAVGLTAGVAATISVAVADDQALVRVGFCGIIAATEGLTVVGQAANGAEAVAVARGRPPRRGA